MNNYNDIERLPDKEYWVEVFKDGYNKPPVIVRVGSDMLQRLVQKYDDRIMVCPTYKDKNHPDNWCWAFQLGFYKIKENTPAVSAARLRNTFTRYGKKTGAS